MINFSNIFISDSFADTAEATASAAPQAGFVNFIPLILVFAVFYFLLIRPQQKKIKEHQNTLGQLKNGDKVQTSSGIFGTVISINDKENIVDLEIAQNTTVKILKQSISSVIQDKTPVQKSKKNK